MLRAAGERGYDRSFIGQFANQLLFYDAPEWVFTLTYVTLALLSILAYLIPFFISQEPPEQERLLEVKTFLRSAGILPAFWVYDRDVEIPRSNFLSTLEK